MSSHLDKKDEDFYNARFNLKLGKQITRNRAWFVLGCGGSVTVFDEQTITSFDIAITHNGFVHAKEEPDSVGIVFYEALPASVVSDLLTIEGRFTFHLNKNSQDGNLPSFLGIDI